MTEITALIAAAFAEAMPDGSAPAKRDGRTSMCVSDAILLEGAVNTAGDMAAVFLQSSAWIDGEWEGVCEAGHMADDGLAEWLASTVRTLVGSARRRVRSHQAEDVLGCRLARRFGASAPQWAYGTGGCLIWNMPGITPLRLIVPDASAPIIVTDGRHTATADDDGLAALLDDMLDRIELDAEAAWIGRLKDSLNRRDPTLTVVDFGDRIMPGRIAADGGPTEWFDEAAADLAWGEAGLAATAADGTWSDPDALAADWAERYGRGAA